MEKKPFVTKEQLEEITKTYPTPFHLYDEKGIRENARQLKEAFSWNKGYKEYFAVKATPNPFILNILKEYGCGTDCSSMTELMMSKACGFSGNDIMFSSNDTPLEEFAYAAKLGAIINLPNDIRAIGEGVRQVYEEVLVPAGMGDVALCTELGRFMLGPYGCLVTKAIHEKHTHKEYVGVDACAVNLMRPAMYGAYHHITVMGKENAPCDHMYDIVGSLCENNDKFAIDRMLPEIEKGDLLVIHDTGAHGFAMGYNYNGKLRSAELLLKEDGSAEMIRRAETPKDYFATFDFCNILKDAE